MLALLSFQSIIDSQGKQHTTSFTYPADAGSGAPALMWDVNDPDYRHMHSQVVATTTQVSGTTTERTTTTFANVNGYVVPTIIQKFPDGGTEYIKVDYGYDQHGNINQVKKEHDVETAYIWGYNYTLPVAQVVGATALEAQAMLDLASLQSLDGQALRDELNTLRSLPNTLVTTYTYDPLRGMTSQTDPSGMVTYYEYDALGRLTLIKDHQSNIVKKYEYNYSSTGGE